MAYTVDFVFRCDRCGQHVTVQTQKWFYPGGQPAVRAHHFLPEGWQDRARPEAKRGTSEAEQDPYYEHVCYGCAEKHK